MVLQHSNDRARSSVDPADERAKRCGSADPIHFLKCFLVIDKHLLQSACFWQAPLIHQLCVAAIIDHRMRQQLIKLRTMQINSLRG